MTDDVVIFDEALHWRHVDRAAPRFPDHDFLFREVAERMADRLLDVNRSFADILVAGGRALPSLPPDPDRHLTVMDPSAAFASAGVVGDPAWLPFGTARFDLIFSGLMLHWVNDLPGALIQMRQALKPDGLLLASMFGGGTLIELRQSLMEAELELEGGASPRVSPFAELGDASGLLQRAGLALPVADMDTITVTYEHPLKLLADLRGMGEQNAVAARRKTFLRLATLLRAMEIYVERFAGPDGRVPATFEIIYLTGWSPHESQQKPLRPGSATQRLSDALNTNEIGAGEKIRPPRKP